MPLRAYEMMFILRPELDEEAQKAVLDKVLKLVGDVGGTVKEMNVWGKRKLAYEIAGQTEGVYVVTTFDCPEVATKEIGRVLDLTDEILRHMIVRQS